MAELDPLVAEILLKGDDEFLSSIKRVGDQASEKFAALEKALAGTASTADIVSQKIGLVLGVITGVTAATITFIEQQTELTQKTQLLAEAFGTTGVELQEVEQIFASSGVKVEQFERFAVRLSTTIAREWPQIAESLKTFANENDASTLRVQNSYIRVQEAQNKLGDNSAARSAQMAKDSDAVAQAYIKLEFAAQHAASEQLGALQAVQGAQLGVTAAEQHLAELEGRPPSAAEKANLAIAQARQAVDQARKGEQDALVAQQEKAAEASLKRAQLEQGFDDARRKAAQNARDDALQRTKDENAVKEAIIARGEAEERAAKFALTNVGSIKQALDGIVEGNKAAATSVDLTQVTVQNLTKSIFALAAETSKGIPPNGFDALRAAAKLFKNDTDGLINNQQRLATVTHLAGSSFVSLGASAAEILDVIEHNSKAFEDLAAKAEGAATGIDLTKETIKDFRGALAGLNLTISQTSQAFAAAIAPAFTEFLKSINESLTQNTGVLHLFIEGLKTVGEFFSLVSKAASDMLGQIDKAFGLEKGTTFKVLLIGIIQLVVSMAAPWIAIPILIVEVITSLGGLQAAVKLAYEAMTDNSVTRFWERLLDVVAKVKSLLSGKGWNNPAAAADAALPQGQRDNSRGQDDPQGVATRGFAGGGHITDGPGTGTSDSIVARLSRGEFVVKAAAVQAYGAGLFHSLNNMMIPGFASGGMVHAPIRAGGGSLAPTSTLNLTIGDRTFNGLRGSKSTIDDLSSFAISRQTSAAGKAPSWQG